MGKGYTFFLATRFFFLVEWEGRPVDRVQELIFEGGAVSVPMAVLKTEWTSGFGVVGCRKKEGKRSGVKTFG